MRTTNFLTVVRFEVVRTLRKPVFWAVALGVPVLFIALAGLSVFSSMAAPSAISEISKQTRSFSYTDDSGLIDPAVAAKAGGHPAQDPEAARAQVQAGKQNLYIHFPRNPTKQPVRVYAKDVGLINNSAYSDVAGAVLQKSVALKIGSPQLAVLARGDAAIDTVTYADGHETGGVREFLPPLMWLVLFFMAITMLGNQMLNITVEEKENRVTEMILTTIRPTVLIAGKVVAVCLVGLVQAAVFALPGLAVAVGAALSLPSGQGLVIDPERMVVGFLLFAAGFLLFTGLLICLGSIMPTAKDAGGAFAAVVIVLFLPLYAVTLVLSQPHGLAAQVMTYFPLTAPMTAMLRNAGGSLSVWEAAIVLVIVLVCAAGFLALGARLFATGSLSYDQRLNVFRALRTARSTAPQG